jgi:exodeoxyribonuclease VII large subunit
MTGIDPRFTLGELALQRDEVVRRLVAEGLYDAQRRLVLSPVPLRLGVVTSVGSAAWHDLVDELGGSALAFRVSVVDTRVQGEWAVEGISAAVRTLAAADIDAVVVVRGGGARSELATFDAEPIARAIAASPVPVLTGLGHEVDRTVADEVAHLSLKTPTACAAALVQQVRAYRAHAEQTWVAIADRSTRALDHHDRTLAAGAHRAASRTRAAVGLAKERLDRHADRMPRLARRALDVERDRISRALERTGRRAPQLLDGDVRHLAHLEARARALDPAHTLARGWSITRASDGRVLRAPDEVQVGEEITTTLAGGELRSRVEAGGAR